MNIYNALPDELQRLVDSYDPLLHYEERRKSLMYCLGKWTGKYNKSYNKKYMAFRSEVERLTIYNMNSPGGVANYHRVANKWNKLNEQMRKVATNQHSVCCMRLRPEEDLVRCSKGHAICKYKPSMAMREDGLAGYLTESLRAKKPYRLAPLYSRFPYLCPVCHVQFEG